MGKEEKECVTGAVITAAGTGSRNGGSSALQEVKGMSLVKHVVVSFQRAGIKEIVLVTGKQDEQLKKELKGFGITFLQNREDTCAEMLDSVKIGLLYLKERCSRAFICPVDVPFFKKETVERLLEKQALAVIPSYDRKGGHPILVDQALFPRILTYEGKDGLRGVLHSLPQKPVYVDISDQGTIAPVYNGEIQKEAAEAYHQNLDRVQVKVRLAHTKPYFGPGMVTLLRQIDALGAVREASEKSGISYSKVWNMIRTAEEETGLALVRRQPGGKTGGKAEVTEAGRDLIRKYEELEQSVEQFAAKEYQRIFKK